MKAKDENAAKPCRVVDDKGNIYSGIPDKSGFGKRGIMLKLKPSDKDYIFPSKMAASSAISHTIEFLKRNNIPMDDLKFIMQETS